jgi:hypothetical protein
MRSLTNARLTVAAVLGAACLLCLSFAASTGAAEAGLGLDAASADRQFNRCPDDPSVNLPGPEICSFSFPVHVDLPAGTRCSFDVTIDYVLSGMIMFFENPPRAVAHMVGEGTATGNGHTLIRLSHFTEIASPEIVFTDHGLIARYRFEGGRTVTVFAGFQRDSIVPPLPEVFHGNPFDDQDVAAFCAALS